jgi:xanthine dehydrogenase small subunit
MGTLAGIRFSLNDAEEEVMAVAPTTTLLRYLRDTKRLTGTKEGCAEGDCGACSVAVVETRPDGSRAFRSVCSCLVFLPMVQGKSVYTVEGIGTEQDAHPAQRVLTEALGSQCGYCTPGVTMSLFEACYRDDLDEGWKIDAQMCGNLCRCTGYRPIRDAAKQLAGTCPQDRCAAALAKEPGSMHLSYRTGAQVYETPTSLPELWDVLDRDPRARFVAGGTDLALEVTKKFAEPPSLISLEGLAELKVLSAESEVTIGAAVTLSDLEAYARFSLPPLERMLRYFGSRQIKNRATLGGNICTASPIGDLAPVLLALDARAVLASRQGEREVPFSEFFLSYRKTALGEKEILARVLVPRPEAGARVGSYKVSKRRELDISTVAAAFYVTLEDGAVKTARLAYGGMAATSSRAKAVEAELLGKVWSAAEVEKAAALLDRDFTPISDHRGSAWYRATVAKNLLRGFFLETEKESSPRLPHRHTATVLAE